MRKELLTELQSFCRLQKTLLEKWRGHCSDSRDIELLLDFPKKVQFEMDGRRWDAVKHGTGVMFRGDDLLVDVPREIDRPDLFDSDRFFDYLQSKRLLNLLGEDGPGRRAKVAELFSEWTKEGVLERRSDERGHPVFSLGTLGEPMNGNRDDGAA